MRDLFPTVVYLLCFLTSGACAYLLARSYRRTGVRLLFWSALCFGLLTINNLMVILDLLVYPTSDFRFYRLAFSLPAVAVLLVGFVWDADD